MKTAAVAAALAIAGCGDGTRAPVAQPAPPADDPRVVDLGAYCRDVEATDRPSAVVDPGAEPRQPVTVRPIAGRRVKLTGTWVWSDDEDEGATLPQSAQLAVEIAAGEPTLVVSLRQHERQAVGRYRIGPDGTLSPDGRWEGWRAKGRPWLHSAIDTLALDALSLDESPPRPVFPDEPIGVGARWTVVTNRAPVRSVAAYELVERNGDRVRIKLRRIACARNVPYNGEGGLDGGWVECESMPDEPRCWIGTELAESLTEGELEIDLAAPLPRGRVRAHRRWRWREPGWSPFRSIATEREHRYEVTLRVGG